MISSLEKCLEVKFPDDLSSVETNDFLKALCKKHNVECSPPLTTYRLLDKLVGPFLSRGGDLIGPHTPYTEARWRPDAYYAYLADLRAGLAAAARVAVQPLARAHLCGNQISGAARLLSLEKRRRRMCGTGPSTTCGTLRTNRRRRPSRYLRRMHRAAGASTRGAWMGTDPTRLVR